MVNYLLPWAFMAVSSLYLPFTILKLILAGDFATLTSWPSLKSAWFGNFWTWIGPKAKQMAMPTVVPLLEGRVQSGKVIQPHDIKSNARGIRGAVLEIGAGSGMWSDAIASAISNQKRQVENGLSTTEAIKIYGVEPNPLSASSLRRKVKQVGLEGVYEVLPYGIEELDLAKESIDCIMTVQCLCSIPEPEKNIGLLYGYLKQGGRWYVYEHVMAEHGTIVPIYQRFTNMFWEYFMGGCSMCRRSGKTISDVGPWTKIDLAQPAGESRFEIIPHVVGVLTK